MENTVFYIKYKDSQPVLIRTHQLVIATGQFVQTLTFVADVIGACSSDSTRRLLGLIEEHGLLTLHSVVDGVEGAAIPGNTMLASIQQPVGSYEQPLIIRSLSDSITMDEHMIWALSE